MSEEQRQMEMHKQLHTDLAKAVRPYLERGMWRSLVLGAFEDVKLVACDSFLEAIRKADQRKQN